MKYTYFFLISALVPSLSHTMHFKNSSTTFTFNVRERKHCKLDHNKSKKLHYIRLDEHGIEGKDGKYKVRNNTQRFNITILNKWSR